MTSHTMDPVVNAADFDVRGVFNLMVVGLRPMLDRGALD